VVCQQRFGDNASKTGRGCSMTLDDFLQAIIADPHNAGPTWLVLADWLEERADPRFELVRLMYQPDYRRDLLPAQRDARVRQLLASGVQPVVPTIENCIGMRFALIPAGKFLMGSPEGEGEGDERPQHEVAISSPFWLGISPVTQQQYKRVMGNNPSYFSSTGDGHFLVRDFDTKQFPVESISWQQAVRFCERLTNLRKEREAERAYGLPTEAEWEYACRGGASSHSPFSCGDTFFRLPGNLDARQFSSSLGTLGPRGLRTYAVGSLAANPFGLFDMHGNIWEWCADWYEAHYYFPSPARDPQGPEAGEFRVLRGGSWRNDAEICRSAIRNRAVPNYRNDDTGFRASFVLDLGRL
jgi:uncharacterized protein (TIGR02996 family)